MNLKDIFFEIFDDIRCGNRDTEGMGRYGRGIGGLLLILPHIIGVILGCAVARMLKLTADGYLHLSVLFALVAGTYKSCSFDKMNIVRAVIKNVIIMLLLGGIFLIAYYLIRK